MASSTDNGLRVRGGDTGPFGLSDGRQLLSVVTVINHDAANVKVSVTETLQTVLVAMLPIVLVVGVVVVALVHWCQALGPGAPVVVVVAVVVAVVLVVVVVVVVAVVVVVVAVVVVVVVVGVV